MKRTALMKRLRRVAKDKGADMTTREGGKHTVVLFDGQSVTTVPRHKEINDYTAEGSIRDAEGRDAEGRDAEGRDAEGRDAEGRDAEGWTKGGS